MEKYIVESKLGSEHIQHVEHDNNYNKNQLVNAFDSINIMYVVIKII